MSENIPVDYVLSKLNEIFQVKDISNKLEAARSFEEAKSIHSQMEFDRVPIKEGEKIRTYYDSNSDSERKIEPHEIISESTGVLQTLNHLLNRDFYFVLSGNDITRIIHYSDLNNPLVLVPIYIQISYSEIAIRNFARTKNKDNTPEGIEKFLTDLNQNIKSKYKIKAKNAVKRFRNKLVNQTQTDLFDELNFDDELILLRELFRSQLDSNQVKNFEKFIDLGDSNIASYRDLRNEIMHSKPEIIKQKPDIRKWREFLNFCLRIIKAVNGEVTF
jgi:hypothetical protein